MFGNLSDKLVVLEDYVMSSIGSWIVFLIILVVGLISIKVINKATAKFFDKVNLDRTLEIFFEKTIKIFLWIILFIILLSNLGVNVSGFIAGLGILGFIVGFATKDVLSNLTAGIFILISQPFKVGDKVLAAKIKGIVKEIGMSTCVFYTDEKEKVIIPNSKIWGGPITNFTNTKTKQK